MRVPQQGVSNMASRDDRDFVQDRDMTVLLKGQFEGEQGSHEVDLKLRKCRCFRRGLLKLSEEDRESCQEL